MSTYTQIFYQIVFCTKGREKVLNKQNREMLYRYIRGVIDNKKCVMYKANGVEDHIHIATHLHPTISLSDLVKDIKVSTSIWIKEAGVFPRFKGWMEGYGAFTYSIRDKDRVVHYIENQEKHHQKKKYSDEYRKMLKDNKIKFEEKYLFR